MKLLIDMNLAPALAVLLEQYGHTAVHWSEMGDARATDAEIMDYADREGYVVITHDLDFGALLNATRAKRPSVIQVRTIDVAPASIGPILLRALEQFDTELDNGALIVIDAYRMRARILPLGRDRDG